MSESSEPTSGASPLSKRRQTREELGDALLDFAATLASYGCPSYRVEDVLCAVAEAEGFRAEPFVTPTSIILRVIAKDGAPGPEVQRMTRLSEWNVDLERLTLVDEIFNDVVADKITVEEARARIKLVATKRSEWSPFATWLAGTIAAGAAAVFFRGSWMDVLIAAAVGAVIGVSRRLLGAPAQRLLHEFLGGLFAATVAWLAARAIPGVSSEVVVLAGAISLFPGMTFTTGLAEIAQKHLVSGGARLMESAATLLLILFGVALVASLQQIIGAHIAPPPPVVTRAGLGFFADLTALCASSLAFGVLFQVPQRFMWGALASGATGYSVTALASRHLPQNTGHVSTFLAALAVCMLANGLARATNRPAQLYQLPGMMLLVPGSLGFLSLGEFLSGNVDQGAKNGFTMALVGAALVIGVLVANVVVPPRKLL